MILRAGGFEFDRAGFELRRAGVPVPVEPLVLSLILHLVENRQRLVTRDELIGAVWQGRAVSDWAVSAAIKAARRALGDTGEPRRFIRTVHGQGVRFVAAPEAADGAAVVTLAVLPFRSLGDPAKTAYLADGLAEDLMIDLARVEGVAVAPRHASFRFRDADAAPAEIGAALGAEQLVTGSVRRSGAALRVNAELVQAASGDALWSDRFDSAAGDVLKLQDAICARLVAALRPRLAGPAPGAARGTTDPQAYDLCLRGRWEYHRYTPAGFARAAEHFAEAIARDGDYAEALAYLSYCRTSGHVFAWPGADDSLAPARALAERAVALDPGSALAHARLGWVLGFLGDAGAATAAFDRAMALDRDNPEVLYAHGETLNRLCKPERARPLIARAFRVDRYVPPSWGMAEGHSLNLMGRHAEAAERLAEVLDRVPGFVPARVQLVRALAGLGRRDDARAAVEALRVQAPRYRIAHARRMFPYPDATQAGALVDALRAAGLPG